MTAHLVVDGYNVLHAWPQTAVLISAGDLEAARDLLVSALVEHQASTGIRVSVVFDSHHSRLSSKEYRGGVEVVFADARHSADHLIERLVFQHADRASVTVATSDGTQRHVVTTRGANCISSPELLNQLNRSGREIAEVSQKSHQIPSGMKVEDQLGRDLRRRLERLRLDPSSMVRRREDALRAVLAEGVVAIIRTDTREQAGRAALAAWRAGMHCIEVTTTVPDWAGLLEELSQSLGPTAQLGAGTVLNADDATLARESGARFAVSPVGEPGVVALSQRLGMLAIPAGFSPTELWHCSKWAAPLVKVFPLGAVDGPRHLRGLRRIFPQMRFAASGGATPDNVRGYIQSGAAVINASRSVFDPGAMAVGDWDSVETACRAMVSAVQRARAA